MAIKEPDVRNLSKQELRALVSKKLLGALEAEVMLHMWKMQKATVQQIVELLRAERPIAYTTVMTVMGHLVEKGLLSRTADRNRYIYQVAQTKEEFLRAASQAMVRRVLNDFGDLAIAGFMGEIGKTRPERLEDLRKMLQKAIDEESLPK